MNSVETADAGEGRPCPKRIWVLTTLSDDEALGPDGSMPRGLQFHLSRCPSCRRKADRLLSVSGGLRTLSTIEPPAGLLGRADVQLAAALAHGAVSSGRVTIPDEDADLGASHASRSPLWFVGRYAAAAAIVIAVGWTGFAALERPPRQEVPHRRAVSLTTAPRSAGSVGAVPEVPQPAVVPDDAVALDEGKSEQRKRPFCSGEAYFSDDVPDNANCVQRAFVLPVRSWGDASRWPEVRLLGNPPPSVSAMHAPGRR